MQYAEFRKDGPMNAYLDCLLALHIIIMFVESAEPSHPGPIGYLNCDTGVTLQIFRNKTIQGTKNVDDPFGKLSVSTLLNIKLIFIQCFITILTSPLCSDGTLMQHCQGD